MLEEPFRKAISNELSEYKNHLEVVEDVLTLKIPSPCAELGFLFVYVLGTEIMISVKTFHTQLFHR